MRVIVCGSRNWEDRKAIRDKIAALVESYGKGIMIVHGGARGADRIAGQEAEKAGLRVEEHPARWDRYGRAAGPIRNREMAEADVDLCVAFLQDTPDAPSSGTRNMIEQAQKVGIPVEIITE